MDFRYVLILLIAFPMGFVSFILATRAWREQSRASATSRWPTTTGQVLISEVQGTFVQVRRGSAAANSYQSVARYAPHIVYQYMVGNAFHQGERLHLGSVMLSSEASDAEQEARRYPIGQTVTVYYNPSDPADSTLDPHVGWGTWIGWLLALGLIALTVIVVILILSSPPIHA